MKENKESNREPSTGQTGQKRDINAKTVLGNPTLFAQFLRDNVNIPCLKNVRPEDIEDVSERYRPYLGTEFESDTVKRVWIHKTENGDSRIQEPLFLISLTEHKSQVDYDVSMQLLKYMLCIWLDYGREMKAQKAGASDRKGFRYPAIIPVVYYEGKASWTAARRFSARISGGDLFRQWIPDFSYEVIRLHDYSNEELLSRGQTADFDTVLADVEARDYRDTHRAAAPLKQAEDAILLDTTGLPFEESRALLLTLVKERLAL